jgi:ATP-dependent exoDNAse (exonuclease V) beta subunit
VAQSAPENTASQLDITVLSAGAGSGKTFTLTGRMVDLLKTGIRPNGIIATTFTQKAAAELQERVRVRLLEEGMTEAANELGSALIGTVHSIGTRLLQRFAFEAGVSPLVEIIAENDGQRLFNESLSQVLTEKRIEEMNRLADRLGLSKKTYGDAYDWRRVIRDLTDVARANDFSKAVLETSKIKSWESFERLLPPVQQRDTTSWNNRLLSLLDQTAEALDANTADTTKATREAAETLRSMQNQLKWREELYWHEWMKIAKTNVAVKSRDLFAPLQEFARSHDEHPQFRADVQGFIYLVFDIAIDALGEFEAYKQKRGLIDYTDMETYVSRLLRLDTVRQTLQEEMDLLLVDEFQDTSPIQLDIFLQLSQLAKHSIWVGDPKQSIYGFRGADPALMKAIIDASGGIKPENILKKSWRSRADLVHAVNAIFTKAFQDTPPDQVALDPVSTSAKEQAVLEKQFAHKMPGEDHRALIHWRLLSETDERKTPGAPWTENAISAKIQHLLARETPVFNKKRDQVRPVQPCDIAVLCRNNSGCQAIADALHRIGIKAAIARVGLLDTPEVRLALACMRYLLTASDALSAAEIVLMIGNKALEQLVEHRLEWLQNLDTPLPLPQTDENATQEPIPVYHRAAGSWLREDPFLQKLNRLRSHTTDLSASEILNLLLVELDLRRIAVQWGNPTQRLDNLDRLRYYALEYESACNRLHSAASLGGLLLWLNQLAENQYDAQGAGDSPDAVKVLTYHRSKGLEYPITICHNLDQSLKEQIWGLNLVSELETPDLNNILGNRWIRFWVNPYADQLRGTRLEETLHASAEWGIAQKVALEEEARLLYVGLTRARDYLVFPGTARGFKWLNRVFNQGDESIPTLDTHSDETPFYWNNELIYCQLDQEIFPREFPEALADTQPVPFPPEPKGRSGIPQTKLWVDTQHEMPPGLVPQIAEPLPFAAWLEFKGDYTAQTGKAVQSACSALYSGITPRGIQQLAQQQIDIRALKEALTVEALALQVDAFQRFIQQQFKPQTLYAQYALEAGFGKQRVKLEVDLYWENPTSAGIILFAPFAEGMKKWKPLAQQHAQTMAWCHYALQQTQTHKSLYYWIVFPVEGQAVAVYF